MFCNRPNGLQARGLLGRSGTGWAAGSEVYIHATTPSDESRAIARETGDNYSSCLGFAIQVAAGKSRAFLLSGWHWRGSYCPVAAGSVTSPCRSSPTAQRTRLSLQTQRSAEMEASTATAASRVGLAAVVTDQLAVLAVLAALGVMERQFLVLMGAKTVTSRAQIAETCARPARRVATESKIRTKPVGIAEECVRRVQRARTACKTKTAWTAGESVAGPVLRTRHRWPTRW